MKRTVSILLALLMCVSMMPNVFAFTPETVESAEETTAIDSGAADVYKRQVKSETARYLCCGENGKLLWFEWKVWSIKRTWHY